MLQYSDYFFSKRRIGPTSIVSLTLALVGVKFYFLMIWLHD